MRVLGIDYGARRLGLALSDATGTLASPWRVLERPSSTAGTLPTYRPQFVGLLTVVAVVITALTYFPVLTLGPLAEGLV